jgi:hypothetical protein
MPATTPDDIFFADGDTPLSIEDISAASATSVQNAFARRQKQSFRWEVADGIGLTENMLIGDTGYNVVDATEYIYDGTAWRKWSKVRSSYVANFSGFLLATTPTTVTAFYSVSAGRCFVDAVATLGTGSASGIGDVTVNLPSGFPISYTEIIAIRGLLPGTAMMRNAAGTVIYGGAVRAVADAPDTVNVLRNSATAGRLEAVTAALPFAWLTLDQIQISFHYPIA